MQGVKKSDLPTKDCIVCRRPFTWRKKWARSWNEVKFCSDRCRSQRHASRSHTNPHNFTV
ncbi:MAG TPA: DUF2256 domain-containing protein [Kiritimatiellia bacterium]|nr:DUF2256 domain-containing protein [Kiritimatiellia bacterium]